jgi:peptide chain release factor 1
VIERLESMARRHQELQEQMSQPKVLSDPRKLADYGRELRSLEEPVQTYQAYRAAGQQLEEAREMQRQERDPEMQQFLRGEEHQAQQRLADLEEKLRILLIPKDPNDDRDVVVEI